MAKIQQQDVHLDPATFARGQADLAYAVSLAAGGNTTMKGFIVAAAEQLKTAEKRTSRDEYNDRLRQYLTKIAPAIPSVKEALQAIGTTSTKMLYSLSAWIALQDELAKGRKPKAVSLTKEIEAVTPDRDETLARLKAEQRRDMTSNRVGRTERV